MTETIIDLIRHGEPEGGSMIRGRGVDHPLSALGWRQMRDAIGDRAPWQQIVSSPMARCRPFALELAGRFQLPVAIEPSLHEIDMGRWEGRRTTEVAAAEPEAYTAFRRDPVRHRPPGGETLEGLALRAGAVVDRLVAQHGGRRLLIVGHAGITRAILGHALAAPPTVWHRLKIDYAGLSRLRCGRDGASVEYINACRLR